MSSDGHKLQESWSNALTDALASFRQHLTAQSSSWRRVPTLVREGSSSGSNPKGKERSTGLQDAKGVILHRKSTKKGDLYRVMIDVPAADEVADLETWKAVLATPELRKEWDPSVESSNTIEMFDSFTRIVKTKFTLGWPANPRDAVMIMRTFSDPSTVIDIGTSLPRSTDEPAYLRPSPPYVRSNVDLFAWCVQLVNHSSQTLQRAASADEPQRKSSDHGGLRITCFWQHDLRTVWNLGATSIPQQLSAMLLSLLDVVKGRRTRTPVLAGYGTGVSIDKLGFDCGRDALTVDYSIVHEEEGERHRTGLQGLHELHALKEQKRLQRSIEILLPTSDGWDVRLSTRASSESVAQLPWTAIARRTYAEFSDGRVCFQVQHSSLLDDHSILKVKLSVEYSAALKGIRLNGLPHEIKDVSDHDVKVSSMSEQLMQDATSAANVSVHTSSSIVSTESEASTLSSPMKPPAIRTNTVLDRSLAVDKSILSRVRRSYIYFSSLLQEPEAKWRTNTEARGVSVTQLDSIDPTLVVYKAEATFVGIGLWDLYSAVVTPGARAYWDKQYEDAVLLEDVNELSELWHYKGKPAWPVTGRDAVVLKTVYKSPSTVHVFAFSVDDSPHLFNIPQVDPTSIRTQVDLQGWAIEALSPTTTLLTLLEQSDPKGWSGKSTIPQQMIANVAGIGEFAIKCGGPPIVTRLGGAKAESFRYEHERGTFRVQYQASITRRPSPIDKVIGRPNHARQSSVDSEHSVLSSQALVATENSLSTSIECELRCDVDTWTSSLDIIIDPPPQSLSCLRRHRLSVGGGGLWLTVGHDIPFTSDERILAIVRRAPLTAGKEKGIVMVNGKRISVDVEGLPESEVKSLSKQKRIKPVRIPLDQPPVLGVIRRRRREWDESSMDSSDSSTSSSRKSPTSSAPKAPSPLSNFFTAALESARSTTQQAVAALSPPVVSTVDATFSNGKSPMRFALEVLSFAQAYHRGSHRDNWNLVADKPFPVYRRPSPEVSPIIPLHRGEKVFEGFAAEEVASVVFSYECRRKWDDRFDSVTVLEEYGADSHTAFVTAKSGFPFRDRGFFLVSMIAREVQGRPSISEEVQSPPAISNATYCISASFNPDSASPFSPAKYNPQKLPIGRVFIDAWILETLDPYTAENYAIPSTRCTRLSAFDYAGSIPVAVNSMINSALPRAILSVESCLRGLSPFPEMRLPSAGYKLSSDSWDATRFAWSLKRTGDCRSLISSKLTPSDKVFIADVVISLRRGESESPDPPNSEADLSTPRTKRTALPSRPSSPDIGSPPRPRLDSLSSPSPSHRHRRTSTSTSNASVSPSASLRLRSKSRDVLRNSSSTFTIGRDFKLHTLSDFTIAEIIVDLRMYPDGYEIRHSSFLDSNASENGSSISLKPIALSSLADKLRSNVQPAERKANDEQSVESSTSGDVSLPISHSVHVLPPSPLYTSAGNSADTPIRHLVRLTLPTAQFEVPSIVDPLTGEARCAPPKPAWLLHLEGGNADDNESPSKKNYAVVRAEVHPLSAEKRKDGKKVVVVNGYVSAVSEKEASKTMALAEGDCILERIQGEDVVDELPKELTVPLAVADRFLDDTTLEHRTIDKQDMASGDGEGLDEKSVKGDLSESPGQLTPVGERPSTPSRNPSFSSIAGRSSSKDATSNSTGVLWNWYPNILRFRSSSGPPSEASDDSAVGASGEAKKLKSPPGTFPSPLSSDVSKAKATVVGTDQTTLTNRKPTIADRMRAPRFSVSTLLAAILIAFLVGSLLRSLLSPADFIYVVSDLADVPGYTEGDVVGGRAVGRLEPGWREIKRLLEVKYLIGGWDFQVAVVRRH